MQNMNYIQFQIPESVLEDFDTYLQTFYHNIYQMEKLSVNKMNEQDHIANMKRALWDIAHAYQKETVDRNPSQIVYNSLEKRWVYLVRHSPCFSSAVAKHFLKLLRSNPSNLHSAVYRRHVRLCCLGGGPGTEAVAIAKVINAMNNAVCPFIRRKLHLQVQVVDLNKDWETTAKLVLKEANLDPKVCDSDRLKISFELLKADLTDPWSEQVRKVIGEADIITMVYFVSAVCYYKGEEKCASMLKNIVNLAKPESLLFFLGPSTPLHFKIVHSAVCRQENLRLIYGPVINEFHTLSMNSIRHFIKYYFSQFNIILCLTNCLITAAGWSKERTVTIENVPYYCLIFNKERKWKKLKLFTFKNRDRFQERVEKLLLTALRLNFVTDDLTEHDRSYMELSDCCWPNNVETLYATKPKPKRISSRIILQKCN